MNRRDLAQLADRVEHALGRGNEAEALGLLAQAEYEALYGYDRPALAGELAQAGRLIAGGAGSEALVLLNRLAASAKGRA